MLVYYTCPNNPVQNCQLSYRKKSSISRNRELKIVDRMIHHFYPPYRLDTTFLSPPPSHGRIRPVPGVISVDRCNAPALPSDLYPHRGRPGFNLRLLLLLLFPILWNNRDICNPEKIGRSYSVLHGLVARFVDLSYGSSFS